METYEEEKKEKYRGTRVGRGEEDGRKTNKKGGGKKRTIMMKNSTLPFPMFGFENIKYVYTSYYVEFEVLTAVLMRSSET
jgi:hypothetical protein